LVWFGLVWFGLVWFRLVWFGLGWFGLVWFGLIWFGLVWLGLAWLGLESFSLVPWFTLRYVNLDDGMVMARDPSTHVLVPDPKFPRGFKPVADAIHSHGMLFGIYTDRGPQTCGGRPVRVTFLLFVLFFVSIPDSFIGVFFFCRFFLPFSCARARKALSSWTRRRMPRGALTT
jgi:hypothetical protein